MFDIFKKKDKKKDDGVVVLRKTKPGMCGGTDATQDTRAPKTVESKDIKLFEVSTRLNGYSRQREGEKETLGFISAFASPAGDGTFLYLAKQEGSRRGAAVSSWALIKENVLPALADLVAECDLAKNNGFHSTTHGLPENFGGSVNIEYGSGEKISFSNNQSVMVPYEAGKKIAAFFEAAMKKEKVKLPDIDDLTVIRFEENRDNGGYTRAELTFCEDGTAVNRKESRYDGPAVYESEKQIDAETVGQIKKNVTENGVFAWEKLPCSKYKYGSDKKMTFVFRGGEEITVSGGKQVPYELRDGFFNVELEMTTKH